MLTATLLLAVALVAPSALSFGNFSSPRMDCNALDNALPRRVYASGSTQYGTSDRFYFAAFENELSPEGIVRPQSSAEVSTVIKTIASQALGYLAIRGGGHTLGRGRQHQQWGHSGSTGFDRCSSQSEHGYRIVALGERRSSVHEQLGSQGPAIPGGRVSKVGVGVLIARGLSHPRLPIIRALLSVASGLSEQTLTMPCDVTLLTRPQRAVCPTSPPPLDLSATMWLTSKSSLHLERSCKPMPIPIVAYLLR